MLDELERLLAAATPRPWIPLTYESWVPEDDDNDPVGVGTTRANGEVSPLLTLPGINEDWRDDDAEQADIALIVAAVNALPALLRVARSAEAVADMYDPRGMEEMSELRAALAALREVRL